MPAENPFNRRRLLPGMGELMNRPINGPDSTEIIFLFRDAGGAVTYFDSCYLAKLYLFEPDSRARSGSR